ncbi:unnamed protein product, partial [Prorocentrum cordatum]
AGPRAQQHWRGFLREGRSFAMSDSDEEIIVQHLAEGDIAEGFVTLSCLLCRVDGGERDFSKHKKFGLAPPHKACFNALQALGRTLTSRPDLKKKVMSLLAADPEKLRAIALAMLNKHKHGRRTHQRDHVIDFCEELVETDGLFTKEEFVYLRKQASVQWFKVREGLSDEEALQGQTTVAAEKPVVVERIKGTSQQTKYASKVDKPSSSALGLREKHGQAICMFRSRVPSTLERKRRQRPKSNCDSADDDDDEELPEEPEGGLAATAETEPEPFVELKGKMPISKFLSAKQKFGVQFKERLSAMGVYKRGDMFNVSDKAWAKVQGCDCDLDGVDYATVTQALTSAITSCKKECDDTKKYNQSMNLEECQAQAIKSIETLEVARTNFDECVAAMQHIKSDIQSVAAEASRKKYAAINRVAKMFEQHMAAEPLAKAFAACLRDAEDTLKDKGKVLEFKDSESLDLGSPVRTNEKIIGCVLVDIIRKVRDDNDTKLGRNIENLKKK